MGIVLLIIDCALSRQVENISGHPSYYQAIPFNNASIPSVKDTREREGKQARRLRRTTTIRLANQLRLTNSKAGFASCHQDKGK
jgi:hypothetical protein